MWLLLMTKCFSTPASAAALLLLLPFFSTARGMRPVLYKGWISRLCWAKTQITLIIIRTDGVLGQGQHQLTGQRLQLGRLFG
jgi:hypothetical protein